jgi:RHS repeat-associated protein
MRRAFIVLTAIGTLGLCVHAQAQTGGGFTAAGLHPNQRYSSEFPFEHISTLSGGLTLTFTDLVLPGNGGRDLRFTRSYNSKSDAWTFGLDGVPLRVFGPESLPEFATADGGITRGISMPLGGNSIYMTDRFWRYFTASRRLWMPDGSVSEYDNQGRFLNMVDAFGIEVLTVAWLDATSTEPPIVRVTQHLGNAQTRVVQVRLRSGHTFCWYGAGCVPSSMTFAGRTWTYTGEGAAVDSVIPPEGPAWQFTAGTTVTTLTTPSGGQVKYTFETHEFVVSETGVQETEVVAQREVLNISGQPNGTWTYDYTIGSGGVSNLTTITSPATSTSPNGIVTTLRHEWEPPASNNAALNTYPGRGWVLRRRTVHDGTTELEREDLTYQYVKIASANTADALPEVATRTITRAGRTHVTEFSYSTSNFGDYHHPVQIVETGQLASGTQTRTTEREYAHSTNAPTNAPYIVGMLKEEAVTTAGDTTVRAWDPNLTTGFVQSVTVDGITTTFTRDDYGNVVSATNGVDTITEFTYEWGRVKDTLTYDHKTTRVINPDGTVASETQATRSTTAYPSRTTTYTYDDAARLITTAPPGGSTLIVTSYASNGRSITTTRGSASTVTTLDGFGRPIGTVTTAGENPIKTTIGYDVEGRVTYAGLPFVGSADRGTTINYDGLSRVTKETHSDDTDREYTYSTGTVTIVDEAGEDTVHTLAPFGHPDDARLVTLVDAADNVWTYTYNARGDMRTMGLTGSSPPRTWEYDGTTKLLQSEEHRESGTVTYQYDAAGRLDEKTDAIETTTYAYDENDRVETVTVGTRQTTIEYEPNSDNRKKLTVDGVVTEFFYDAAGRLWKRTDTLDSQTFTTTYTYDTLDRARTITYPSGRVVGYDYDTANRITRVFDPATGTDFADDFDYHASGGVEAFTAGNNITTTQTYDPDRYWLTVINSGPLQQTTIGRNEVGNVTTIDDQRSGHDESFGYTDHLHRLTSASGPYVTKNYSYDAHGNRVGSGSGLEYTSNPFKLSTVDGQSVTYDDAGRLKTVGFDVTYNYTLDHQLASATVGSTTTNFTYDGDGWRIKKTVGSTTSYYLRGPDGQLLAERTTAGSATTWRDYVYAGGRPLAAVTTTNVTALPSGCTFNTPLVPGDTVITTVFVTELRTCVNNLRTQRGLSAVNPWPTDPTLTAMVTVIKAAHIDELRSALNEVYDGAGLSDPSYTETPVAGQTTIKAVYFTELRGAIAQFPTLIATPQIRYYHLDAIGSVRALTNAAGNTVARYDYEPFGAEVTPAATERDPLQFAGTERDAETGTSSWQPLDYMGARYTQNRLTRFLSPDDPAYGNPFDPQSMNQYAYAYNNPLGFVDPTGHQGQCVESDVNACVSAPMPHIGLIDFLMGARRPVDTVVPLAADVEQQQRQNLIASLQDPNWCSRPDSGCLRAEFPVGATSKVLLRTASQLARKFHHASAFGILGNYSRAAAAKFSGAIHQHINSAGVRAVSGSFRRQPVTHCVNLSTGLNVIAGPAGDFVSAWKLNAVQLMNVLKHGGL